MITKRAELALEKRANQVVAGLAHVAQNIGFKHYMKDPRMRKLLWQRFSQGALGNKYITRDAGNFGLLQGNFIPEIKILANEAHHLGQHTVKPYLDNIRNAPTAAEAFASKRNLVRLKRVASGEFSKILKRPMSWEETEGTVELMKKFNPKMVENIGEMKLRETLWKLTPENAKKLEQIYAENPLTSMVKSVVQESRKGVVKRSDPGAILGELHDQVYRKPYEYGVNGLIAAADPITAGVNVGKQVVFNKDLGNQFTPLKAVQNYVNDKFVNQPIQKGFAAGLPEKTTRMGRAANFVDENVVNPLNYYTKDLAKNIGELNKDEVIKFVEPPKPVGKVRSFFNNITKDWT